MKKIFVCFFLLSSFLFAQDLFWAKSLENAKYKAAKENKLVFVIYTQSDSALCEYMKDITFDNKQVSNYLKENFIMYELDINDDRYKKDLKAYGTPTSYILTSRGKKVGRQLVGASNAQTFLETLKQRRLSATSL